MNHAAAGAMGIAAGDSQNQGESLWTKKKTKQSRDILLYGRPVRVTLSAAAATAMAALTEPLLVEAELYFSCLIRKRLLIRPMAECSEIDGEPVTIDEGLLLRFRPVVTQHCSIGDLDGASPPLATMPVKNHRAFVPHWVNIDYRKGQWSGEFGFAD